MYLMINQMNLIIFVPLTLNNKSAFKTENSSVKRDSVPVHALDAP